MSPVCRVDCDEQHLSASYEHNGMILSPWMERYINLLFLYVTGIRNNSLFCKWN